MQAGLNNQSGQYKTMSNIIFPHNKLTLPGLFIERSEKTPDRTAYKYFDQETKTWETSTWSEMSQEVARWQAALKKEHLHPGDKIAIMLPNCREWIMMEQAALGLGLVIVPLFTNDRADNVAYILQDASVKLLIVEGQWHLQQFQTIHSPLDCQVLLLSLRPF